MQIGCFPSMENEHGNISGCGDSSGVRLGGEMIIDVNMHSGIAVIN